MRLKVRYTGLRFTIMEHIHFIGIGGIGVSALARYHLSRGDTVSGSDLTPSEITADLARAGVFVIIGPHAKPNVPSGTTRVIYTAAIPPKNPERAAARARRIPAHSYAEAVGDITKKYKTVTISGSHGKTTTTALAALVLEEGYFDPTVIVGAKIKEFGNTNFRRGQGSHLVLEADEWNRSFLNYSPHIAVVTNIDAEHLDTYGDLAGVESAFKEYLGRVPADGAIIANRDDEPTRRVAKSFGKKVTWYSVKDAARDPVRAVLKISGEHNISNALAALTVGRVLGIREPDILRALSRFTGAWRRFEFKGLFNGAFLFSDYAHHPREIAATLSAARERFPLRRVVCVYQPHQHQRLQHLWDDFLGAFDLADRVVLLPVYDVAGRDTTKARQAVNSEKLVSALQERGKDAGYVANFAEAREHLRATVRPGDSVLLMGAGDIYDLTTDLSKNIV